MFEQTREFGFDSEKFSSTILRELGKDSQG